jgi:hypothetical protein
MQRDIQDRIARAVFIVAIALAISAIVVGTQIRQPKYTRGEYVEGDFVYVEHLIGDVEKCSNDDDSGYVPPSTGGDFSGFGSHSHSKTFSHSRTRAFYSRRLLSKPCINVEYNVRMEYKTLLGAVYSCNLWDIWHDTEAESVEEVKSWLLSHHSLGSTKYKVYIFKNKQCESEIPTMLTPFADLYVWVSSVVSVVLCIGASFWLFQNHVDSIHSRIAVNRIAINTPDTRISTA